MKGEKGKQPGEQTNPHPASGPSNPGGTGWAGAPLRGPGERSQQVETWRLEVLSVPRSKSSRRSRAWALKGGSECTQWVPGATSLPYYSPCAVLGELLNLPSLSLFTCKTGNTIIGPWLCGPRHSGSCSSAGSSCFPVMRTEAGCCWSITSICWLAPVSAALPVCFSRLPPPPVILGLLSV